MKKFVTAISVLTLFCFTSIAFAEDVSLTPEGKVPGKPFVYLQEQIDALSQKECTCDISREEFDDLLRRVAELENQNRCLANVDCTVDSYCAKLKGDCEGYGTCKSRPQACTKIYLPVCGCDGITYGNECEAAANGVSIAYDGECKPPPGQCQSNNECQPQEFCDKNTGDCEGFGVCAPMPVACIEIYDPVCGCDGMTYSNECFADAAGVNVLHPGTCENPPAVCNDNVDCPTGQYCKKGINDCLGQGECADMPLYCPMVYDPVCGCDGMTYGNTCEAAAAGVNVVSLGVCP